MKSFLAIILLLASTLSQAVASSVYIVLSEDSKLYQQAAQEIQFELSHQRFDNNLIITSTQALDEKAIGPDDLIVTLGPQAASISHYSYSQNTHIFTFIDRTQIPSDIDFQWAAIVLDQPLQRLIAVAESIVTDRYRNKIIVAVSENNQLAQEEITAIRSYAGVELEVVVVDEQTEPAKIIDEALMNAGALLAIRDDKVWSGDNAKWMLYKSFKLNVPVIGYSQRFLRAGALVAAYSTLSQNAQKTAQLIIEWNKWNSLTEEGIVYPDYQIGFNESIARALKIRIPETLPTDVRN